MTSPEIAQNPDSLPPHEFLVACGAIEWIRKHRVPPNGPLVAEATAAQLGIKYREEKMATDGAAFLRATDGPISIFVREDIEKDQKRLVLGHELGHYFLYFALGRDIKGRDEFEESFCEAFGFETALPQDALTDITDVTPELIKELMETYQSGLNVVLHQLQRAGKLPLFVGIETLYLDENLPPQIEFINREYACVDCTLGIKHDEVDETGVPILKLDNIMTQGLDGGCSNYLGYKEDRDQLSRSIALFEYDYNKLNDGVAYLDDGFDWGDVDWDDWDDYGDDSMHSSKTELHNRSNSPWYHGLSDEDRIANAKMHYGSSTPISPQHDFNIILE